MSNFRFGTAAPGYDRLISERREAEEREERERISNIEFVATLANSTVIIAATFREIGDKLVAEGYMMARAWGGDVITIPHPTCQPATVERRYREGYQEPIKEKPKQPKTPRKKEKSEPLPGQTRLKTRECGAIHSEGVICVITIYYESNFCDNPRCTNSNEIIYNHQEPHEHVDKHGVVTHRWEEVMQIREVDFDAYKPRGCGGDG